MPTLHDAVHAYAAAINSMSAENFTACFAPGGELRDPVNAPVWIAPEGTTAFYNQFLPIIEKVHFRAGRIHVAGRQAAFTFVLEATGKNGAHATAEGVDIALFDEAGKIVRLDGYWEPGPFVAALTA